MARASCFNQVLFAVELQASVSVDFRPSVTFFPVRTRKVAWEHLDVKLLVLCVLITASLIYILYKRYRQVRLLFPNDVFLIAVYHNCLCSRRPGGLFYGV